MLIIIIIIIVIIIIIIIVILKIKKNKNKLKQLVNDMFLFRRFFSGILFLTCYKNMILFHNHVSQSAKFPFL